MRTRGLAGRDEGGAVENRGEEKRKEESKSEIKIEGGPRSAGCMTLPRSSEAPSFRGHQELAGLAPGRQDALKITPPILSAMITEI